MLEPDAQGYPIDLNDNVLGTFYIQRKAQYWKLRFLSVSLFPSKFVTTSDYN